MVVGENVSFDALFGTYQPVAGESVANLLSKGIVYALIVLGLLHVGYWRFIFAEPARPA